MTEENIEVVEKTKLEDFSAAEHAAVDRMAAPIIASNKANKRFRGQRNRKVWMRMNRPEKMEAIERGATKIHAFLDRVLPKKELTVEEAHELLDDLEDTHALPLEPEVAS